MPPPPMAIPLIASYAASALVTEGVISLGIGLSVTAGAAIVGGAAALAAGYLVNKSMADTAPPISAGATTLAGAGRTQQIRQPTAPHEVVVGRVKKSGPIMFIATGTDDGGRADGYFYIQIVLASHHCKAIGDVYLDADLSTAAKFTGFVTIGKHLGAADQAEDATFLADLPVEFANHRLRGRAHIASRLKGNGVAFPASLPNHACIVWGADEITDPRTSVAGWTNNAILIVYWWMLWGEGYTVDDFHLPTLIASANVCDERVRVRGITCTFTPVETGDSPVAYSGALALSAGARLLDVGDGVRVSSSGALPSGLVADTTYYIHPYDNETVKLCATVTDAFDGAGVSITSAGSGTLTLTYWDEARYKCNGSFSLDSEKREIRDQLLTACAGHAIEIGGLWYLHAAAAATPTVTLTEDDLRDSMVTVPKRSMRDKINTVRAVFVNPDNDWQPSDAPPLTNAAYIAEDNGVELPVTLRLPFTISGRCVQRIQKMTLEENHSAQRTVKFPAKLTAMRLRPLDGVYLTIERYDWVLEQHRCMGWVLAEDGGIDLLLNEDSPAIHAWNYLVDEQLISVGQGVTLPDPSAIAAPASVTVTTPVTLIYVNLAAQWSEVLSIWSDGYDVEYRDAGGSTWTGYGRVGSTATREVSVERTTAQDFRVRAVTTNGSTSAYTMNLAPGAPTDELATGVDITWTNAADADQVQVFSSATTDLADATLFDTVAGTDETVTVPNNAYYWLRSVNTGGNISAPTAMITVGSP